MIDLANFLSKSDEQLIIDHIASAEQITSGEIRVHIENYCNIEQVLDRAAFVFHELDMQNTQKRNGILLYIAVKDRKTAIIGDVGINRFLADDFWDCALDDLLAAFQQSKYRNGLVEVIDKIANVLSKYFPVELSDINELPNDISYG